MLHIGCHLSSSKGFLAMGREAVKLGADTFQYFTRNPRGSRAKAIDPQDVAQYREFLQEHHFAPVVAHAPYTLNACSADPRVREFAWQTMADDLRRMEYTPGGLYNFHPGSHVGQGPQEGVRLIAELLNGILTPETTTTVLLETMAGKGSEVGRSFEELARIIEGVHHNEKLGVCLDTCHVWDAGYDIAAHLDEVLQQFDDIIGLERLKALHVNDSMNPLAAHKDRHAKIGEGHLGLETFGRVVRHPALRGKPMVLETPNDDAGWAQEIALLRRLEKE